jgi:hypothetical protein
VIIFGTRNTRRKVDSGTFACPACGVDRPFTRLRTRRFGHIFFIPLIPMGTPTEVVQCGVCRRYFRPDVLAAPTTERLVGDINRVVQLVAMTSIVAGGSDRPLRAQRARDFLRERGWSEGDVESAVGWALGADAGLAGEMHVQLCHQTSEVAAGIELAGREAIVMAYGWILGADASFDEVRAAMVGDLGRAAGLTAAHVQGIVATIRDSLRPST